MKEYKITEEQINMFITYLQQKPFIEVEQGINILRHLPIVEVKPVEE